MIRLIIKDIKDTWVSLLYLFVQISLIFILFTIYFNEAIIFQSERDRMKILSEVETIEFTANLFYSVGDFRVDSQDIVFKERDYLNKIFMEKRAFTAIEASEISTEYPIIVVIGDINAVLELESRVLQSTEESGVYLGQSIPDGFADVGEKMDILVPYAQSGKFEDEVSFSFDVLGRLEANFDLPNLSRNENLDNYILISITLEEYRDLFINDKDTALLENMVVKDFNEDEIMEYINKFSFYPYRIIRQKSLNSDEMYLKRNFTTFMNITLFVIANFSIAMYVLFVALKRIFIKKYQEWMVARIYGSGWFGIYARMLFLILLLFTVSLLFAYTSILKYLEFSMSYYIVYLLVLFIFSIIYTAILFKGVRANDGKL